VSALDPQDVEAIRARYAERYSEFGYSPQALGWWGGRQELRFDVLLSQFVTRGRHILDVGCGFGDLNTALRSCGEPYRYTGIDLYEEFIAEGRRRYGAEGVEFRAAEFLGADLQVEADFVIASGLFNHRYEQHESYDVIAAFLDKAMRIARIGIAFDVNSHFRPDQRPHLFYADPGRVLGLVQQQTTNACLRHDYMPFEFAVIAWRDDGYDAERKVYHRREAEEHHGSQRF
jgi:SAM-dependent methyltransferase